MNHLDKAVKILAYEEGYRESPYYCSEGYPTIGIGQKIGPRNAPLDNYQFALPLEVAEVWCKVTVADIDKELVEYTFYNKQNADVRAILLSMAYQLGISGLLRFKKMVAALERGELSVAAFEAKDSRWYRQTPKRAERHSRVIAVGDLSVVPEYKKLIG